MSHNGDTTDEDLPEPEQPTQPPEETKPSNGHSEPPSHVVSHYDRKPELGRKVREASKIIRLRSYNNWLKATLLQAYLYEGARVLDIGVGKGGDLVKYSFAGIGELVAAGE